MATEPSPVSHIRLTSHPVEGTQTALPIRWGAPDPHVRGPIVGSTTNRSQRNVIGTHSGSYGVYRALAVAAGALTRDHRPDLTNTMPTDPIGPYPQWGDPANIVTGLAAAVLLWRRQFRPVLRSAAALFSSFQFFL